MLVSLTETEARDLLEIIHARHNAIHHLFVPNLPLPAGTLKSQKPLWPTLSSIALSMILILLKSNASMPIMTNPCERYMALIAERKIS